MTYKNPNYQKEYRLIHKEETKKYQKEYRKNHNEESKAYRKKYYNQNREEIKIQHKDYLQTKAGKETQKKYRSSPKGKVGQRKRNKRWRQTEKGKITHRKNAKTYRQENPEKVKAQNYAKNHIAIPSGQLCQRCNKKPAIQKHHEDYSKPAEVDFLCRPCHIIRDKERRELVSEV